MFLKLFRNEAILKEGVATQIHAISSLASKLPVTNKKNKYGDKTPEIQHVRTWKIIVSKVEISSSSTGGTLHFQIVQIPCLGCEHSGNSKTFPVGRPGTFAAQPWRALRFHRLPSERRHPGWLGSCLQGPPGIWWCFLRCMANYTP